MKQFKEFKQFKVFGVLIGVSPGMFYIRFTPNLVAEVRGVRQHPLRFSERMNLIKYLKIGNYIFTILAK